MTSSLSRSRQLTALIFAGFIPLLIFVPALAHSDVSVISAATVEGYNTGLAYRAALAWSALGLAAVVLAVLGGWLPAEPIDAAAPEAGPSPARRWLERGVVLVLTLMVFAPPLLARHGPYIEDPVFLTALHRMTGGQVPYRDFEFLYGPLMLYPAYFWIRLTGYSMRHYYQYLALLEAVQGVILIAVLQRFLPRFRTRLPVFLALALLLANPLLGLNYNGFRRLLPAGALLILARSPGSRRNVLGVGALLGLAIAYSHDYGLVALVSAAAFLGLLWMRRPSLRAIGDATLLGVTAIACWLLVSGLLLGSGFPAYIADTRGLVARFSAGEAGFRFYWTLNSLAGFALLSLALVTLGGLLARRREPLSWGDGFFVCMTVATLLALKSGLNRSDVWHLDGALFFLTLPFLAGLPMNLASWSRPTRRLAATLVGIVAVTCAIGNAPSAAYMAEGWMAGLRETFAAAPPAPARFPTAAPMIEYERSQPRSDVLALSAYLAQPDHWGHPVLFYGALWGLGEMVGVYKRDHLNDDFIYANERGRAVADWLLAQSDPLVVIDREWYDRLYAPAGADTVSRAIPFRTSAVKSAGEWLASVHYRGLVTERRLTELRWRRTVGLAVRGAFTAQQRFGRFVVL
ncbi:MAG TPA: hypothetical protein VGI92_01375, partial [Gemmatimonadales bacterium]